MRGYPSAAAIINIAGLAVGIAVCMIIFIIIQFQTGYDTFHSKKDRVYRVLTESHHAHAATVSYAKNVSFPMPEGLKTTFPQLQQVAPVYASHNDELQVLDANGTPVKSLRTEQYKCLLFDKENCHQQLLCGNHRLTARQVFQFE